MGRLEPFQVTAAAVRKRKDLTTQNEMRSFLDRWNVFGQFVPNVSRKAPRFSRKLRKDQATTIHFLARAKKEAVENLKTLLTSPPVLAFPQTTGQ